MRKTPVQEERSKKPPIFSLDYNGIRLKCSDSMQHVRVIQIANGNLEQECDDVKHNQRENCRSASELTVPNYSAGF